MAHETLSLGSEVKREGQPQASQHLPLGSRTLIMGIVNVTPDSFSDGGQFLKPDKALAQARRIEAEGADIIDVGAESTRPGAVEITAEEELARLVPVLQPLVQATSLPISVDTYKAAVAREALRLGASMVNDVGGLQRDPEMAAVVAEYQVPVVIMHNQEDTVYESDLMEALSCFFEKSLQIAHSAGVLKSNIILDPGIGFGKTFEHNIEVLRRLKELESLGYPLLLGVSRKSVIGHILDLPPQERLEGTLAAHVLGIQQGVAVLRVHDVAAHRRAVRVADKLLRPEGSLE